MSIPHGMHFTRVGVSNIKAVKYRAFATKSKTSSSVVAFASLRTCLQELGFPQPASAAIRRPDTSTTPRLQSIDADCRVDQDILSTKPESGISHGSLLAATSVCVVFLSPALPVGAVETAPEGFFDLVFHTVESLGPFGPIAFILAVSIFECIPLFPTQPLSLASGLLFGTPKGALCMLTGTTLAAFLAFTISRGVGRPFAERIIRHEMASSDDSTQGTSQNSTSSPVQEQLKKVQTAIENGTFWQQTGAIFALRLTPIVPFSASNYILGLSPLPVAPYLIGTMAGMGVWSCIYASLGGASRVLLRGGADPDVLLNDLIHKAGSLTQEAGAAAAVAGGIAGVVGLINTLKKSYAESNDVVDPGSILQRLFRQGSRFAGKE